ncbi:MAG: polysaccharide biosynthesis/export family protein [Methyloligellaceae bacterium]
MNIMIRYFRVFIIIFISLLSLMLHGCSGGSGLTVSGVSDTGSVQPVKQVAAVVKDKAYRLGTGDKLQVTVEGVKDHSGEFDINGNGSVSMPFVGNIKAAGLTVNEFSGEVTQALKKYVRNPQVRVSVLNYRPFYIQGEVKQGGQYNYSNGLDVRRAVAIAGGYTYRAVKGHVFIQRANESQERKYSLTQPVLIQPGDNIRIPERFF